MTSLPHRLSVPLRYSDTDMQGHVNNAVYSTFYESGRVNFIYDSAHNMPPRGCQFVIAQITIKFIAEIRFPGTVDVRTGVTRIGTSSMQLRQELHEGGELKSSADSVIVLVDMKKRTSTPIDDTTRAYLQSFAAT